MLHELRRLVIGDEDIGKRLVVTQQHVEARPQALDEVRLQQQRLGFGPRRDEFHRRGLLDHADDPVRLQSDAGIAGDALLEIARLADIEHVACRIEHAVDAGRIRQALDEIGDHRGALAARGQLAAGFERHSGFGSGVLGRESFRIYRIGRIRGVVVHHRDAFEQRALGKRGLVVGVGGRNRRIVLGRLLVHSLIPTTSGVSQARCWPPSSAIIWPVIERVS